MKSGEVERFDKWLRKDRQDFPLEAIQRLLQMKPGVRRAIAALKLLPWLLRMARRTLEGRWRSALTVESASYGSIVTVHAVGPGGGFISGWHSKGRWWTRDFVDDGTTWGTGTAREIRVVEYRHTEGALAEPWHEHDEQSPIRRP